MNGQFLFDTAFSRWTAELVDQFFQAHVAEDEHIEYKESFSNTFQDTLVSFSNGEGGYIFVGVKETPGKKIPVTWWLLDSTKDNAGTVYNKAGSETTPSVRPIVSVFDRPGGAGQVVVIKVEPGENPPYFAKQRGVKVRVGDTDIDADPRVLEALFARRAAFSGQETRHRTILGAMLSAPGQSREPLVFKFCVYLAPLYEKAFFRFTERTTEIVQQYVRGPL